MPIANVDVKPLRSDQVNDASLFADRYDLLKHIASIIHRDITTSPNILEIGVALGDFSLYMIEQLKPKTFAAVDLFDLHLSDVIWGVPTSEMFGGRTQIEFYRDKIQAAYSGGLLIEQGYSAEMTLKFPDNFFELIYIDAGHDYENVKADALASLKKLRPGGFLIFNDYTMMDHLYGTPYGVVPAANEIIHSLDKVNVVGFGLNPQMFCDLAVQVG